MVMTRLGVPDLLVSRPLDAETLAERTGTNADAMYRLMRALASEGLYTVDGETVFEYFSDPANAEIAGIFDDAMSSISRIESQAVLRGYDFSEAHHVVDVGGGQGLLLRAVLSAVPTARGVLFDLPPVVAQAHAPLQEAGLADRCEVVGGSFFDPVPAGGDLYMLKHIVHDWSDEKSLAILRRVREAIADDGRLLLLEMVIPDHHGPYHGKILDLEMLVLTDGGRERTEEEFRALLAQAGFELTRVVATPGPICVVEARPR